MQTPVARTKLATATANWIPWRLQREIRGVSRSSWAEIWHRPGGGGDCVNVKKELVGEILMKTAVKETVQDISAAPEWQRVQRLLQILGTFGRRLLDSVRSLMRIFVAYGWETVADSPRRAFCSRRLCGKDDIRRFELTALCSTNSVSLFGEELKGESVENERGKSSPKFCSEVARFSHVLRSFLPNLPKCCTIFLH